MGMGSPLPSNTADQQIPCSFIRAGIAGEGICNTKLTNVGK